MLDPAIVNARRLQPPSLSPLWLFSTLRRSSSTLTRPFPISSSSSSSYSTSSVIFQHTSRSSIPSLQYVNSKTSASHNKVYYIRLSNSNTIHITLFATLLHAVYIYKYIPSQHIISYTIRQLQLLARPQHIATCRSSTASV